MTFIKKLYFWYCRAEEVICGVLFSAIVVLVFSSAFLRLFQHPLIWADDIAKLCFAWAAFLGADVAMRYCRLVGVDFIMNKINPMLRKILYILGNLAILVILGVFAWYGFKLAGKSWERYFQTINVSYSFITLSLPCGALAMILTTLIKIGRLLMHINDADYSLAKDAEPEDMERQII